MIKKLTAVITAFMLVVQALPVFATGEYYEHREYPTITAEDFVYKAVDITEVEGYVAETKELVTKKGNDEKMMDLIDDCFDFYRSALNSYVLASIVNDRDFNTENTQNLNNATKTVLKTVELISEMIYSLYESDYQYLLAEIFGTPEDAIDFALPKNDEIGELINKEEELVNRYSEIYGDVDACAELFIELMGVRNKIAQIYGYDNYAEYAHTEVYSREHTKEQLEEFYSGVKEYITPLYRDADEAYESSRLFYDVPMSEDDVLLNARRVVEEINPELAETFEYLIANNIYDIKYSDKKNPSSTAYTTTLLEKEVPYIFVNPDEDYEINGTYTVKALLHEFGHFASMLKTPVMDNRYDSLLYGISIDTAEIHSQGLEVLAEPHYGKIFSIKAPEMRYCTLVELMAAIIDGCMLNKWQERIYAMENPTVDDLNNAFVELMAEFRGADYTPEKAQKLWTAIPHNYSVPMYYLSYALSAMTVLGIYSESVEDYEGAVDTYMRVSAEGVYKTFAEITEECDLYDIYDVDFISEVADNVEDTFALGYSDLPDDVWYLSCIYTLSNIMPGRTEDTFAPDEPITRAEFVGTLGRMYDYYVGIDETYETSFADVADDENEEYIAWAEANGIVDGYDDEMFGANDPLTREQAVMVLFRLADETIENVTLSDFVDADSISEWAKESVAWGYDASIVIGRDNGEFDPKDSITRAEAAKIITGYMIHKYENSGE